MIMASVGADGDDTMFQYVSIIRGHYIYKNIWTPRIAEVLSVAEIIDTYIYIYIYIYLCCDPVNRHDRFAVAIFKTDVIAAHMPKAVSRIQNLFNNYQALVAGCSCLAAIIDLKYKHTYALNNQYNKLCTY